MILEHSRQNRAGVFFLSGETTSSALASDAIFMYDVTEKNHKR